MSGLRRRDSLVVMPIRLAQTCAFATDVRALRRFLEVVSGELEHDDGNLLSFRTGAGPTTVAAHPPAGDLAEGDVLVTLEASEPAEVDALHRQLVAAGVPVDDTPETTGWGYRLFYYRAGPHLVFEIGAPAG